MLPIAGRAMIEWVADHLARHGVSELILAMGYKADGIADAYRSGTIAGLPFQMVVEPEARDTAGAIKYAVTELGIDQRCVVVNGDVLSDLDITALVRFHESRSATATISLQPVAEPERFGIVVTDSQGLVQRFVEKPLAGTEESNLASAGTYVLEPSVMAGIEPDRPVSIEREVFPQLVEAQVLYAMEQDTYWLDTGTPEQFLTANMDVLSGLRPLAHVLDPASGSNGAGAGGTGGDGSQISKSARVRSSVIGKGCRIEADAVVERSVVMDDCVIRSGAVVSDSILAPDVQVGATAIVADCCVIGRGQRIAAGAVLSGIRQPAPSD